MAVSIPSLPMAGSQLKSTLDGLRAFQVVKCPSVGKMLSDKTLVDNDRCSTPEGMFEVVFSDKLKANGSTVLAFDGTSAKAVLLASEPLNDVASIMADTRPAIRFSKGSKLYTKNGHAYEVAPEDATDQHLTTAGGTKLYVLPVNGAMGFSAEAFGVDDTGSDSSIAEKNNARLQMAIDTAHAKGYGQVFLGRSTYMTSLKLRPGVVLVGGSATADVGTVQKFGGIRTGSGSYLIQADGVNAPAVYHDYVDYDGGGLSGNDKARGLGLRNILIRADGAYSETNHPVGVKLESCVFIIWEKVFVQGFYRNIDLQDCWDSTFIDLRTGPCEYGLRIGNRGNLDNSNNLKFLHTRMESWNRNGLEIVSGGPSPYQNNKIEFFGMKNEGHPGANGESCIKIDGNVEIRFWGGYTSITNFAAPSSNFKLLDLTATTMEMLDVHFAHFGLATNNCKGEIDSIVSVDPGKRNVRALELDLTLNVPGNTVVKNGIINFKSGNYKSVEVNVRNLYNPANQTLLNGIDNVPQKERLIKMFDKSFYESISVKGARNSTSIFIEQDASGKSWEIRAKNDGSIGLFVSGTEACSWNSAGNLSLSSGKMAVADAFSLRSLSAAPSTLPNGLTMAFADGKVWDPAKIGSGPYLAAFDGKAWHRVSWS